MKTTYKIILAVCCQLSIVNCPLFSQTSPAIQWQNTIGGSSNDELYSIQQTADGGYIVGGWSASNVSVDKTENSNGTLDYWIVKTDATGNIQWQNTIGGNNRDELYSVQQTADGGYILGGSSNSDISGDKTENNMGPIIGYDYWIVKTDATGTIQWENTIGGYENERLYSVRQTSDGGYILGGSSTSDISGDKTENTVGAGEDYWIVKTDPAGNIQWQNTIGGYSNDYLTCIEQTADGGYIVGGRSNSDTGGDKTENCLGGDWDYWIIKTDASGNIQWDNTIGGNNRDNLYSIHQTADGGYIVGGLSESNISGDKTEASNGGDDFWIIKTDPSGNIQWQNTIGGSDIELLNYIKETADGGYVLGGYSRSNISGDKTENCIGGFDYWIIKTDSSGNVLWDNTIGGSNDELFSSMQQTADGGYILGGYSESNISGDKTENCLGNNDYWIVKLYPDTTTGIADFQTQTPGLTIYPNPANNNFTITFPITINKGVIEIYNVLGEKIFKEDVFNASQKEIYFKSINAGIYFVKVRDYPVLFGNEEKEYAKKLVIE